MQNHLTPRLSLHDGQQPVDIRVLAGKQARIVRVLCVKTQAFFCGLDIDLPVLLGKPGINAHRPCASWLIVDDLTGSVGMNQFQAQDLFPHR